MAWVALVSLSCNLSSLVRIDLVVLVTLPCYTNVMSHIDSLVRLRKSLHNAQRIEILNDKYLFFYAGRKTEYDEEILKQFDSRLPEAVKFAVVNHKKSSAKVIRTTIKHWVKPEPPQEDSPGFHVCYPKLIVYANDDTYVIQVARYMLFKTDTGVEVAVPVNKHSHCTVSKLWLDTYYPGLSEKVCILKALNVDDLEISSLTLAEYVERTRVTLDITFD